MSVSYWEQYPFLKYDLIIIGGGIGNNNKLIEIFILNNNINIC